MKEVLQQTLEMVKKVTAADTAVTLIGEMGTGKRSLARAIHAASSRAEKPFVVLNCNSTGKDLLERELFGYKASTFAGDAEDRRGLIEEARGGTVFLNEVGDLPVSLQVRLLRMLDTGQFYKIGSLMPTEADVRVISASSRKLETGEGKFRMDLFCRLNECTIEIPPLRERKADIPILASYFVNLYARKLNRFRPEISDDFLRALERQPWRGNVRELKNVIERVLILSSGPELGEASLPPEFQEETRVWSPVSTFDLASVEKLHIERVLHHTKGNKVEAAKLLNIGLTTIYRKIEEYGLA